MRSTLVLHTLNLRLPPADIAWIAAQFFARWQLPDRHEVLTEIPRTSTGKFWKLRLREMFLR